MTYGNRDSLEIRGRLSQIKKSHREENTIPSEKGGSRKARRLRFRSRAPCMKARFLRGAVARSKRFRSREFPESARRAQYRLAMYTFRNCGGSQNTRTLLLTSLPAIGSYILKNSPRNFNPSATALLFFPAHRLPLRSFCQRTFSLSLSCHLRLLFSGPTDFNSALR